ncbi:leucine--tRNA ligase [Variovorax sp. dw_954]|uniref:leucine--tRNA ligase n=1 Tax=Variovorax sp. dw_954 TaxID=2720078 RepID=UPI001BD5677B|nr:leucine--tRNA ligase [Variovorax sp. dw_954]
MNPSYTPSDVESAAQADWRAADAYRVTEDSKKKKYYACSMLPYPSGRLHMGHVRNYTINDMLTRYLRMSGYNVLMPMGWDAFGLPAENAALKNGVPPAQWTYENIASMKEQLQAMGLAIDWSREIATCDPAYYKWNQWLFLKMLEKGIAYRKTQVVNWDPVDQTVLANEQVIDGKGWRTGATVERREIPGYYLKISDYAEELLEHTQNKLPGWPERVKLMQENWIGKSSGVRFAFPHEIKDAGGKLIQGGRMYVFTTRADTIMGVTFCAVAPEHPLALHAARTNPKVAAFIEECKSGGTTEAELATQEKKGVATGLFVQHPITEEPIPVWVGNYVLMSYGDGAVMGVPAHDERDFAFANKYGLEILQVIIDDDAPHFNYRKWQDWYADKTNGVTINSDVFSGMRHEEAVNAVAHALQLKRLGDKQTTWRLRDWGVSRQRYWGTPIPIIHCEEHGAVPVPEKDLPVVLPTDCVPDGSGNPLNKHEGFHAGVTCPVCGKPARRETDTMDTFVDSSWYFMRYCDPHSDNAMVDGGAKYWMAMDQYIGGIEHAILHLLYARFWTKVMRDLKLVTVDEPFSKLLTQGMVLNHIYYTRGEKGGKDYYPPADVTPVVDAQGRITGGTLADGTVVEYGGVGKMGKTERNGVDPQDLIEKYGADTARLYTMFTAPPEATLEWNDAAVEGSYRFLRRVWNFGVGLHDMAADVMGAKAATGYSAEAKKLRREVHTVLRQIDYDYQRMQYNTVVSGAMKLLNALEGFKPQPGNVGDTAAVREGFGILLRCLYPATPHIAQQLWKELGYRDGHGDLLDTAWPKVDAGALEQDEIELMLQVNGKLRGAVRVPSAASKQDIEKLAVTSDDFVKFAPGAAVKRVIVVPGRLVNVVV